MILAVDPGKDKCGIAVLDISGKILERKIIPKESLPSSLPLYAAKHGISTFVIGQSSFGKELEKNLLKLEIRADVIFVSEKYSTLEARRRYWKENRPKGFLKLVPTSMRIPPVPVDDYAAVIIGERFLRT